MPKKLDQSSIALRSSWKHTLHVVLGRIGGGPKSSGLVTEKMNEEFARRRSRRRIEQSRVSQWLRAPVDGRPELTRCAVDETEQDVLISVLNRLGGWSGCSEQQRAAEQASLRLRKPANAPPLIITLDGPAGTGKSSLARALANRLGFEFLDSGAMYRAVAARVVAEGVDPRDTPRVVDVLSRMQLTFDWSLEPPTLMCNGARVLDSELRSPQVDEVISTVAAIREVREVVAGWQRRIAIDHPRLVTEGRDQARTVFPDAPVKFFIIASAQVRAERRAMFEASRGRLVEREQILKAITERDLADQTRSEGPLRQPPDAIVIDTTCVSFEMVVELMVEAVHRRTGQNPPWPPERAT